MLGQLNFDNKKVTVIGAGISGLLAAWYLNKSGFEVTIYEKEKQAGGLIKTIQTQYGIAEKAALSVLATSNVIELFNELNLELLPVEKDSKSRFILRKGKMRRFPLSLGGTVKALFGALFIKSNGCNQNLDKWVLHHLGSEVLEYIFTPFVTGIYGAKPSDLSTTAAFPMLQVSKGQSLLCALLKKKNGKVEKKSRPVMMSPYYGMESLISALENNLKQKLGERFITGKEITTLPDAPNLVITVPAQTASMLLANSDTELSQTLSDMQYTKMITATIFISNDSLQKPIKGVGVLIPPSENSKALGVLFNSSSFKNRVLDPTKLTSLTMMLGGTHRPELLNLSDNEIKELVTQECGAIFGANTKPLHIEITKQYRAIPLYSQNLQNMWNTAKNGWCKKPGNVLFGNYTGLVSIRGMIENAKKLASTGELKKITSTNAPLTKKAPGTKFLLLAAVFLYFSNQTFSESENKVLLQTKQFQLISPAFKDGGIIPSQYTGIGKDISPPIEFMGAPSHTNELALICEDIDAKTKKPWVHWVLYKITFSSKVIDEGVLPKKVTDRPPGAFHGINSWNKMGYKGPIPPAGSGWHRYNFTLYALSHYTPLKPGATKAELMEVIKNNIIATATLSGKYKIDKKAEKP